MFHEPDVPVRLACLGALLPGYLPSARTPVIRGGRKGDQVGSSGAFQRNTVTVER